MKFKTDKDHIKLYNDGNNTILIMPNERLYQATGSKKEFDRFLLLITNVITGFWFKRHKGAIK